jgi:hypothetical protein
MILAAAIVGHELPGRLRVRVPSRRHDHDYFARAADALAGCPGVEELDVNTATASLLVTHTTTTAAIRDFAQREGLFALASAPPPQPARRPLPLRQMDGRLAEITGGAVGLREALALAFLVMAVQQALRGNVMAPAASLLWYALEAARLPGAES